MQEKRRAFTIIEVVLVLAIGGLVFIMVFIALPALQRAQRNTQRESDAARVVSLVSEFQSNNGGKTPFEGKYADRKEAMSIFVQRYVMADESIDVSDYDIGTGELKHGCNDEFKDPVGECYMLGYSGTYGSTIASDTSMADKLSKNLPQQMLVVGRAKCGVTEDKPEEGAGARSFALFMMQEGGGIYCVDNQ